jgi:hypothetical protein
MSAAPDHSGRWSRGHIGRGYRVRPAAEFEGEGEFAELEAVVALLADGGWARHESRSTLAGGASQRRVVCERGHGQLALEACVALRRSGRAECWEPQCEEGRERSWELACITGVIAPWPWDERAAEGEGQGEGEEDNDCDGDGEGEGEGEEDNDCNGEVRTMASESKASPAAAEATTATATKAMPEGQLEGEGEGETPACQFFQCARPVARHSRNGRWTKFCAEHAGANPARRSERARMAASMTDAPAAVPAPICRHCEAPCPPRLRGTKPRVFCSEKCSHAYWKQEWERQRAEKQRTAREAASDGESEPAMACSHPRSAVVSSDEGTAYCGGGERRAAVDRAQQEQPQQEQAPSGVLPETAAFCGQGSEAGADSERACSHPEQVPCPPVTLEDLAAELEPGAASLAEDLAEARRARDELLARPHDMIAEAMGRVDPIGEVLTAGRVLAIHVEASCGSADKEDLVPWAKACGRLQRAHDDLRTVVEREHAHATAVLCGQVNGLRDELTAILDAAGLQTAEKVAEWIGQVRPGYDNALRLLADAEKLVEELIVKLSHARQTIAELFCGAGLGALIEGKDLDRALAQLRLEWGRLAEDRHTLELLCQELGVDAESSREKILQALGSFSLLVRCRVCGCTDEQACPGGCHWVEDPEGGDLCSVCAERLGILPDGREGEPIELVGLPRYDQLPASYVLGLLGWAKEMQRRGAGQAEQRSAAMPISSGERRAAR